MKALWLHYNEYYWPIIGLGDGGSYLHRQDWQVNTKESLTKQGRQDAILGGLSIGQFQLW